MFGGPGGFPATFDWRSPEAKKAQKKSAGGSKRKRRRCGNISNNSVALEEQTLVLSVILKELESG